MLRRVTLSNAPACDADNPFFKVYKAFTGTLIFSDTLEILDAQIFPYSTMGYFVALQDSLNVTDYLATGSKKGFTIILRDSLGFAPDEFDAVKTRKHTTITLTDSLQISD